jgi:hypothetical protein
MFVRVIYNKSFLLINKLYNTKFYCYHVCVIYFRKTENVLNVHIDVVPYFDLKNMEMDIDKAFTMTSEIIALEIVNRIMITLFEVKHT